MIGIYCIRNTIDNKRYIGQSIRIQLRKYEHFESLRKGTHFNPHLQSAYNLYGSANFVFEVLEECSVDMLSEREIYWISFFGGYTSDDLYNISPGGKSNAGECNPMYGKHWSDEQRANQSKRMKEYFSDPTHHPMYGKHFSEESRAKMSATRKGKLRTDDAKQKTSETLRRKYATGEIVHPMLGKHLTDETIQKLRNRVPYRHTAAHKEALSLRMRGAGNPMYGKHHTESARLSMSKNRCKDKNGMYGKIRINNGVINSQIPKGTPIPDGFVLGMLPRKKHNNL